MTTEHHDTAPAAENVAPEGAPKTSPAPAKKTVGKPAKKAGKKAARRADNNPTQGAPAPAAPKTPEIPVQDSTEPSAERPAVAPSEMPSEPSSEKTSDPTDAPADVSAPTADDSSSGANDAVGHASELSIPPLDPTVPPPGGEKPIALNPFAPSGAKGPIDGEPIEANLQRAILESAKKITDNVPALCELMKNDMTQSPVYVPAARQNRPVGEASAAPRKASASEAVSKAKPARKAGKAKKTAKAAPTPASAPSSPAGTEGSTNRKTEGKTAASPSTQEAPKAASKAAPRLRFRGEDAPVGVDDAGEGRVMVAGDGLAAEREGGGDEPVGGRHAEGGDEQRLQDVGFTEVHAHLRWRGPIVIGRAGGEVVRLSKLSATVDPVVVDACTREGAGEMPREAHVTAREVENAQGFVRLGSRRLGGELRYACPALPRRCARGGEGRGVVAVEAVVERDEGASVVGVHGVLSVHARMRPVAGESGS